MSGVMSRIPNTFDELRGPRRGQGLAYVEGTVQLNRESLTPVRIV
jgi:hypothetical protein